MLYEDGVYTAAAHFKLEDESTNPWSYYPGRTHNDLGTMNSAPNIGGWVQLFSTSWSPSPLTILWGGGDGHGSSAFRVTVMTTTNCTGTSTIRATLNSPPSGSTWLFGDVTSPQVITYGLVTPPQAGVAETLPFVLDLNATIGGNLFAEAAIIATPSGCNTKMGSGNPNIANLSVN